MYAGNEQIRYFFFDSNSRCRLSSQLHLHFTIWNTRLFVILYYLLLSRIDNSDKLNMNKEQWTKIHIEYVNISNVMISEYSLVFI